MSTTNSSDTDLEVEKQRLLRQMMWKLRRKDRIIFALLGILGLVFTRLIDGEFLDALLRVSVGLMLFAGIEAALTWYSNRK